MSWLVNLYPCKECGTPTKVRRRDEIPEACCEKCHWFLVGVSRVSWAVEAARDHAEKGNAEKDSRLIAMHWFRSMEDQMLAQAAALDILPQMKRGLKRSRMARALGSRLKYVREILEQLEEHVEGVIEEEIHLEPVAGGGDVVESHVRRRVPPSLRIVSLEGET